MRPADTRENLHPAMEALALFSSGDLHWITRWRIARHLRQCAACDRQVSLFRSATEELKHEATAQTLTSFEAIADWTRLEREMLGNIGVGVAAARCIDKVGRKHVLISRGALIGGLAALFIAGWITHIPSEQTQHLATSIRHLIGAERPQVNGTLVETTRDGIAVRVQGATLTIMHPPSAVVSLSGRSGVAARYVDQETGQVTITNVYGQ